MFSRRVFLRNGALAVVGTAAIPSFLTRAAYSTVEADAGNKRLVVIFQRGAADGLNIVVPHGEQVYYAMRPSINIPRNAVIDLDGFFGLHPSMSALQPLWNQRHLAILHAAGSPDPSRSHFDAQDFMESGTPGVKATEDGWLNRALRSLPVPADKSAFRAIGLGPSLPRILAGPEPAVAVNNISEFGVGGRNPNVTPVSNTFEAMYANIPGLKVISTSTPYEAKGSLKAAIRDDDPVIFMESEVMYGEKSEVPEEEYYIQLGKADVKKEGNDVTIVSYNKMMKVAMAAAEELAKEGIEAEVIDLATIRPLDWFTILESVKKTNRLVIVEEQWPFASVSSEIAYRIQKEGFDYLDAPIRRITSVDAPMHYAPNLVAAYLPDVPRTVKLVKEVMYLKK